jgi:hypothetical protein
MNLSKQFDVPVPEGTYLRRSGGIGHMAGDESRSITKMLPIGLVKRYAEYNRLGKEAHPDSEENINKIANELKSGGVIKEPLMLEHSTKDQWGYLGEGHHRLLAAERAGHTHVPVFVYSGASGYGPGERKKKRIGAPLTLTTNFAKVHNLIGDYQPEEIHPNHFAELR